MTAAVFQITLSWHLHCFSCIIKRRTHKICTARSRLQAVPTKMNAQDNMLTGISSITAGIPTQIGEFTI